MIFLLLVCSLSNLFDRLFFGFVIDYIRLSYENYSWYIFNISDTFISLYIFFISIEYYKNYYKDNL